jgi:phosphoglucomutase
VAADARVGKTLVSSSMIDRVVAQLGRKLSEVPVGFKWFAAGLVRRLVLLRRRGERGRELPAPRRDRLDDRQGRPDPRLLAAEITATHRQRPRRALRELDDEFGAPALHAHRRPATPQQKAAFKKLTADAVTATTLAGDRSPRSYPAPGNNAPIGGLKITTTTAGSPRGRAARRTSTRSTPRASSRRSTCSDRRRGASRS